MSIAMIPASKLKVGARNVRKTGTTIGLESLKADIAARGVLQNLVAVPARGKRRGQYEVVAGARRLAAIEALIAEGALAAETVLPVLVLDDAASAGEASLAENFQRAAMNPADECTAFRHFIETDGASVEEVATRFGVSTRFVEGRIRLASLAEPVFEALRQGEIPLDLAQAFGSTADTGRQLEVWAKLLENNWMRTPHAVRRALQEQSISAADRIARFVGEAAYVEAGGRVERDLFGDEEATIWTDPELARRLAQEKLESATETTKSELGVTRVIASVEGEGWPEGMVPIYGRRRPFSDEEVERAKELREQLDAIEAEWGDDAEGEAPPEVEATYDALRAEYDRIHDRPVEFTAEQLATATAMLVIDREGNPCAGHTLFGPRSTRPQQPGGDAATEGADDGAERPPSAKAKPLLSERLGNELAHDRAAILQLALASNARFAKTVLAFCLAEACLGDYRREQPGFEIRLTVPSRRVMEHAGPEGVEAGLAELRGWLRTEWAEQRGIVDRFDAFRTDLSDSEVDEWLAWCFGRSVEKTLMGENRFHDHLGALLAIDVPALWRPTAANYFGRIRKEAILDALEVVGGQELKGRYASAKKADLAQAAERIFSGEAIIEPEARAAACGWVPDALTFALQSGSEAEDEDMTDAEIEPDEAFEEQEGLDN